MPVLGFDLVTLHGTGLTGIALGLPVSFNLDYVWRGGK